MRALAALASAVLVVALAQAAAADFRTVAPNFTAWRWAVASNPDSYNAAQTRDVRAIAVRPDGWLIVAAEDALHLIPPSGGTIDESNLFGPPGLYPYDMVLRDGALYATVQTSASYSRCPIYELDPTSGAVLHTYYWSQCYIPHITLDPLTNDLVLQAVQRSPCSPCQLDQQPILEWDPDTGKTSTLVSHPRTPFSDLAFSADGSYVWVGEETQVPQSAPLYIDAYPRQGSGGILASQPSYRVRLPDNTGVNGITYGDASRCFGDSLLYTDAWSDVYEVSSPGPKSTRSEELATTPPPPGPVRYADSAGNVSHDGAGDMVIGAYNTVMVLSCSGFRPVPAPSVPVHRVAPPPPVVAQQPSAPVHAVAAAAPPQAPPPPAGPPPPPPAAPAPAPAVITASQGSTQVASAPNVVGVGDVAEDQPAFHLTATALARPTVTPAALALGGLAVTGMALGTWTLLGERKSHDIEVGTAPAGWPRGDT
ncbi:MAG TPA: hypothetical protein VFH45_01665 [Acidimicrobiales bacterium]|nr:hypothetical protein [Acidimicrobiales bacterium]